MLLGPDKYEWLVFYISNKNLDNLRFELTWLLSQKENTNLKFEKFPFLQTSIFQILVATNRVDV